MVVVGGGATEGQCALLAQVKQAQGQICEVELKEEGRKGLTLKLP